MTYVFGIDVGVASLALAVVRLDKQGQPAEIIDGITEIYDAPKGGAERRQFKSMRTQTQRRTKRLASLKARLSELLNIPAGFDDSNTLPDKKSPGEKHNNSRIRLRSLGLSEELSPSDLARAITHIARNRGQRLSRGLNEDESDSSAKSERTATVTAANQTAAALAALQAHPSELLARESAEGKPTRLRGDRKSERVFTRKMVEAEFNALLNYQMQHHPVLRDPEIQQQLFDLTFHECEVIPPEPGRCRYGIVGNNGKLEPRLARGTDLFQTKRVYEEINNIRLIDAESGASQLLSPEQRDILAKHTLSGKDVTGGAVRRLLKLGKSATAAQTSLDIAASGRKAAGKIAGHPGAVAFSKAHLETWWQSATPVLREAAMTTLREQDDIALFTEAFTALGLTLDAEQAKLLSDQRVPAGYSAAGATATRQLLEQLQVTVIDAREAENRAGLRSLEPDIRWLDQLPYYGELLGGSCVGATGHPAHKPEEQFGKIPNPVVHVALNRLRRMVNAYIKLYGKPSRICIELARDLNQSAEQREEAEKEAEKNRKANERYIEEFAGTKQRLTASDLRKLKLHKMQGGCCLYTGKVISREALFDGTVEIDHILPRRDTMDDGFNNLALVTRTANRFKGKRPPFEAFHGAEGYEYAHILERAKARGSGMFWRFQPNAMERFADNESFRARYLNDTRYIAKMARAYLAPVCQPKPTKDGVPQADVVSLNGRITNNLKKAWGLGSVIGNLMEEEGRLSPDDWGKPSGGETLAEILDRRANQKKIRWDHRHHLLDAIVAACVSRSDVQNLQTETGRGEEIRDAAEALLQNRQLLAATSNRGICWDPSFHTIVMDWFRQRSRLHPDAEMPATAVIHKAEHNPMGALHKATNYRIICAKPGGGDGHVVLHHAEVKDIQKDTDLGKLTIERTVRETVVAAKEAGCDFHWGGSDPVAALDNLERELERLRQELTALKEQTHPDKQSRSLPWQWASQQLTERTGQRRFSIVEIKSVRILRGPAAPGKAPRQANATGGNHRLIWFITEDGSRDWEIVTTLDANNPGFVEGWRRNGGRPILILHKGDIVEMTVNPADPESERALYRTVRLSPGDIEFLPVVEARNPGQVPKTVRTRITSLKTFAEYAPQLVLLDSTGRMRWRGRKSN